MKFMNIKTIAGKVQDRFDTWRWKREDAREVRMLRKICSRPSPGYLESLAKGIPVTVAKGQIIYKVYPDGHREQVGFIDEPDVEVPKDMIRRRRRWRRQVRADDYKIVLISALVLTPLKA